MENVVTAAKAEFDRAKGRLIRALETTPDDKINWTPAGTARTPVQLVVHGGIGTSLVLGMLQEKPFAYAGTSDFDSKSRLAEKEYNTREQALAFLESTSGEFFAWLDTLTPEQVASTAETPFGPWPVAVAITFPADHLRNHAGQIEYIQTILGDHDWHL